jgi:hypothetical protein
MKTDDHTQLIILKRSTPSGYYTRSNGPPAVFNTPNLTQRLTSTHHWNQRGAASDARARLQRVQRCYVQ